MSSRLPSTQKGAQHSAKVDFLIFYRISHVQEPTYHGKGPADGIASVLKRARIYAVMNK